jgi:hypothetical protein
MYREVVAWIEGQADLIFCHNGQCAEGWLSATPEEREERLARNDERMRSRSSGLKTRAIAAGHIQGVVVDDRIKREANEVVVFMHSRRIIRHEASIERARRLMAEVIAALSKLEQNDREALDAAQKALVGR